MKIGSKKIGPRNPVFIIAEAGVNHNNKLSLAYRMIDLASKSGADAIKFQSFITENMQLKDSQKPQYQNNLPWSYYEQLKKSESSFDFQKKLIRYCNKRKILFLSTPYDEESLDFLMKMKIPALKVSASDTNNHLFLKYIIKQKKPILLSTGLSSTIQLDKTINFLKKNNAIDKLVLLQTNSDYPTPNEDMNLRVITEYSNRYGVLVGLSDHSPDYVASIGAVALGACVLEKHFTLSKKLSGPDQSSSLEPTEFKNWIKKVREMEVILGNSKKTITNSEKKNLSMRKILVISQAKKGTKLTMKLLKSKRGNIRGVLPMDENIKKILGKKLKKDLKTETQFDWKMI